MNAFTNVAFEALLLVIVLSAGPALAAFVTSVIVSALQSATQMQDVTLTFVPKIAATFVAVVLLGTWMVTRLADFTAALFAKLPAVAQSGG